MRAAHTSVLASALLALSPSALAAETILGVYMFHRHGDRTAKALPPTSLTQLGYNEVYTSGTYFHQRYVSANSTYHIAGISSDGVRLSQIQITAPVDNVLQNSAMGFSQALYPALGESTGADGGAELLRNGSTVQSPLNGYQLIPVNTITTGASSESSSWLQSTSDCANAEASSNEYFYTPEYMSLLHSTAGFYSNLLPVIQPTLNSSTATYKNAYTIFDLINVAEIHNQTIPSSGLLTPVVLLQLQALANAHEYNLAWNASSTIRAIAGMTLAGQVVSFLNSTITSLQAGATADKLAVQFGAYGSFTSLFGLIGILPLNVNLTGVCDYASALSFELFTNTPFSGSGTLPASADLNVRFRFHNGTTTSDDEYVAYPLFGGSAMSVSWSDFTANMAKFSISNTAEFCTACGNSTGICAPDSLASTPGSGYTGSPSASNGSGSSSSSGGMSLGVAGVIGAMVTLGVILLVEAAILLLGGFRLIRKKRLVAARSVANGGTDK